MTIVSYVTILHHQWGKCGVTYGMFTSQISSQRHVEEHKNAVHRQEKDLHCMLCNKAFNKRGYLVKHVQRVHRNPRQKCNICEKELSSKHSLNDHMEAKHAEQKDLKLRRAMCIFCDKILASKYCLRRHIKSLHKDDEKKMLCPASCVVLVSTS